jgi:hypothetical protein
LPACGPYLAIFNISPNNYLNTKYNSQYSKKEPFTTATGQMWQIRKAMLMTTSSREDRT